MVLSSVVSRGWYDHPDVRIGDCAFGYGLFLCNSTTKLVPGGTHLAAFDGLTYVGITTDDALPEPVRGYPIEIGPGIVRDSVGVARWINHSCEPNCGFRMVNGLVWIVSRRRIYPGEELTVDYGTAQMSSEFTLFPVGKRCLCGTQSCRSYWLGYDRMPRPERYEYMKNGIVLPHLLRAHEAREYVRLEELRMVA